MNWWSKYKNKLSLILIFSFCIGLFVIIGLIILGPIFGDVYCTLSGCFGSGVGVHLNFPGSTPNHYSVTVEFPSGPREIVCDKNLSLNGHGEKSVHCTESGAFFAQPYSEQEADEPPEELVVTVEYEEKMVSKTFRPKYHTYRVNGEDCPPLCYSTMIYFDFLE